MNWAMPCARSPLRVRGPTTSGWKRLSCQITRAKNSSGKFCARAAASIMRQSDSRTSTFPVRAGGGGAAGGVSAVAGGGVALLSAGGAGVVAAGGDVASLPAAGGAFASAGVAGVAGGAAVSDCCASPEAAANSISAMIAMRAMRDNNKEGVIVARQHSSARQSREARRAQAAGAATDNPSTPASPPPFTGEGQGGGMQKGSRVRATPSPTLQPKSDLSDFGRLLVTELG